ncbi:MAG: hexitol phosphatase HxpB [Chitinophagales bacterium]|nr:hexitol phosphatase HxpB [Bacteroidota bacterium]MCB9257028.1 hexitol phosphatase HxpB [Chitinophagales bacterium]
MIKGVIFDMDGLLIDSEPFWRIAETEAFAKLSCKLTDDMLQETMGMRNDEVVRYWVDYFELEGVDYAALEMAILARVQELVEAKGEALPFVVESLEFFKQKQIPIALASSSPMGIIQSVVDTLGIEKYFKVMCSAEFEEFGKPHPAVFIAAANYLRVDPSKCLVFEDSLNGLIAAKAAKMHCIAVPDSRREPDERFVLADACYTHLGEFLEKDLEAIFG